MPRKSDDGVVRPGYSRRSEALRREIERHRADRGRSLRRQVAWFFAALAALVVGWLALIYGTP